MGMEKDGKGTKEAKKKADFPLTVAIIGLGGRGRDTYAPLAKRFPDKMKIVAIADPVKEKRDDVAREYNIAPDMCFETGEEMLARKRLADILFICSQDRDHYHQAMAGLERGYHILLEKPISPSAKECADIARLAKEKRRHVQVCHVLRYTPFFRKIKQIIDSGRIGEVVNVQAKENVVYWHQAHSFVRGNWKSKEETSPMILAKSCHDMDILLWLTGQKPRYVSSFGDLFLFKPEKAPAGAGQRCTGACAIKDTCPYNAEHFYIDDMLKKGDDGWPVNILNIHPTVENIEKTLQTGPYGKCVYHAGNDVVDHQVVNVELENGATISFTMCAFTSRGGRHLHVMGTMGDIEADMDKNIIRVCEFEKEPEVIDVNKLADDFSGHGGGDYRMVEELLDDIASGKEPGSGFTSIDKSVESHYLALAAEDSRLAHGQSIDMREWEAKQDV